MEDPFDLSKMALDAKLIAELMPFQKTSAAKSKRQPRPKSEFVQLPFEQILAAAGLLKNTQLAVLMVLAHREFKTHKNPVRLAANEALKSIGVSNKAKLRALRHLEAAGLISMTKSGQGKAQLITLLWKPPT
jgi:DNA-binding MarR family transcriptional regulator